MLKFLTQFFDENQKKLDRYQKQVNQINALEEEIQKLSDAKLAKQTQKFQTLLTEELADVDQTNPEAVKAAEAAALEKILPEAFATVREVSRRVLGLRHFDVQLLAGVALHYSNITEQKTGEGKTLTVSAPLYLNALLGKGSHLVTVNDYLAEVGAGWMAQIYHFLGLSTAVIVHDQAKIYDPAFEGEDRGDERLEHFKPIARREAYAADITYGTNNEFGFDYLRDNMVQSLEQMVQRVDFAHHFAIVDEADSILIDEARTPLIISAPDSEPTKKYYDYAIMVRSLVKDQDFKLDEKAKSVNLTDLGVKRIEQKLGVKNLYEESFDTIHHVEAALKAATLYHRDTEYIVRDNQVIIVDEHTGRLMYGRRYSDGLHQSIEAKEGVPIQQESRTLATISLQNYFRLYTKLSGMTGTAATEAEEFNKIYHTDVLVIPTHKPMIREDKVDTVYKTVAAKYSAIVREVEFAHESGRPILIGTRSIDHNQVIADFLKRKGIEHQILNAKNHEKEAFIIADAGKKNAITVATNIAGRGVDIVLGGAKPELKDFRKKTLSKEKTAMPAEFKYLGLPASVNAANYKLGEYAKALEKWQLAHDEVVAAGGLCIIATERHESRRIDNQLRGRSGRQGDPGSTQFFVALDDDIMRIFGGDQIAKIMDFLKIEDDQPIEHGMVSKSIESAQVKVEGFFFDQRKRLVEFDDVMNQHRDIVYHRRRSLLELASAGVETSLKTQIMDYLEQDLTTLVTLRASDGFSRDEIDAIIKEFIKIIPFDDASQARLRDQAAQHATTTELIEFLLQVVKETYQAREKVFGKTLMRELERAVTLSTIDEKWMDHLDEMDALREGIWLRGDKRTVLSEYQKEAFVMFETLMQTIESTIASRIFRVQPMTNRPQSPIPAKMQLRKDDIHESLAKEVSDATPPTLAPAPRQMKGSIGDLAAALQTAKAGTTQPQPGLAEVKIGRNEPCPCGSGLKYKKCGLIGAPQHRG
ncbi:MAG TPA: preprotein translocase subunit SecA [Candidatus Pacebacteria bacterium]|nr:preprotein translocase subunit SecA [Candidatus Paceibacterota bacterium]